jgi:hypothetical protein
MESVAEVPTPNDDKYIVFKRSDFVNHMSGLPMRMFDGIEIMDAVVIRRQDYFAAPALATYASTIGLATHLIDDPKKRAQMLAIADYFQRQSEIAGDEAWKFPDI